MSLDYLEQFPEMARENILLNLIEANVHRGMISVARRLADTLAGAEFQVFKDRIKALPGWRRRTPNGVV